MKKLIVAALLIVALAIAGAYIFIPPIITAGATGSFTMPSKRVFKFLENDKEWMKWWPGKKGAANFNFEYGNTQFAITEKLYHSLSMDAVYDETLIKSSMVLVPLGQDKAVLNWEAKLAAGLNPFKRYINYQKARAVEASMKKIVAALEAFVNNPTNAYGMKVDQVKVVDTFLLSQKKIFKAYPSTAEVYDMVYAIKDYLAARKIKETGYPMLHVEMMGNEQFETMVAIPIDHQVPNEGPFVFKLMIAGNILRAEVKGDYKRIKQASEELENYRVEHQKTSPAIPFEMMVTDRLKEKDSSQWITRLYYPVF
ncbi:MAG: hypothetical protein SFU21_13165 [Flavihumibacter sp.]|nr:hypothetical protein [Flavihumibacter sp.]